MEIKMIRRDLSIQVYHEVHRYGAVNSTPEYRVVIEEDENNLRGKSSKLETKCDSLKQAIEHIHDYLTKQLPSTND